MVNRAVRIPYEEWHTGVVTWYNKKPDKNFTDKSEDYLKIEDFNGVDVISDDV